MFFWFIAIAVTAIVCAALYYAAAWHTVNEPAAPRDDGNAQFRLVLAGIDVDLAAGKLGEAEAGAAKAELAREMIRQQAEAGAGRNKGPAFGRAGLLAGLVAIGALSLGSYAILGRPGMPSQPLAGRAEVAPQNIDLDDALARIEAQLAANPDDLRGWTVIAPAYTETGRYEDAERAYRRIIALGGSSPDVETSLAEALMLANNGDATGEAMTLLQSAAAADPEHVLSRLYIAAELTRSGQYDVATTAWQDVLALSTGDEPWLSSARQGLLVAQNDGAVTASADEAEFIGQMVQSLSSRLASEGGSIEEWTQLVRAYLVLDDRLAAQAAFDTAVIAYPRAFDRGDLDTLALAAGLTLNGATP